MAKAEHHPLYAEVGRILKDARRRMTLNQDTVAILVGMERSGLAYIEAGTYRPSLLDLIQLCEVLKMAPGDVLSQAWDAVKEPQTKEEGEGDGSERGLPGDPPGGRAGAEDE